MAGRGEISWKDHDPDGNRREVLVRRHGDGWDFLQRARRFDQWERWPHPGLEEWRKLLDAVERRAARRLCRPEDPALVRSLIRRHFPEADL